MFKVYVKYFFNLFIFNWRIIALQCCVAFCHTSTWIIHKYIYVPSSLNLPPISHLQPHPTLSRLSKSPIWVPWDIQQISNTYLFYIWYYICFHATLSIYHRGWKAWQNLEHILSIWRIIVILGMKKRLKAKVLFSFFFFFFSLMGCGMVVKDRFGRKLTVILK